MSETMNDNLNNEIAKNAEAVQADANEKKSRLMRFLEMLKELIEVFKGGGVYKSLDKVNECLGEMTYTNAATAEILTNLINIMDKTTGELKGVEIPSEAAEEKLKALQEQLEEQEALLEQAISNSHTVTAVIDEFEKQGKNYGIYTDDKHLYLAELGKNGAIEGKLYEIERVNEDDKFKIILVEKTKETDLSKTQRDNLITVCSKAAGQSNEEYRETVKEALVHSVMSDSERQAYDSILQKIAEESKTIRSAEDLHFENSRYTTNYDENEKKFYVADRLDKTVYVFENSGNMLSAQCYQCDNFLKPKGEPLFAEPIVAWEQRGNDLVYKGQFSPYFDTKTMFKLNVVQKYLTNSGINEHQVRSLAQDFSSPEQNNEKMTANGAVKLTAICQEMIQTHAFKDLQNEKDAKIQYFFNGSNGNCIVYSTPNESIKINVDKDCNPVNIEFDIANDDKGYEKTHYIAGKHLVEEKTAGFPLELQMVYKMFQTAENSEKVKEIDKKIDNTEKKPKKVKETAAEVVNEKPLDEKPIEEKADAEAPAVATTAATKEEKIVGEPREAKPVEPLFNNPSFLEIFEENRVVEEFIDVCKKNDPAIGAFMDEKLNEFGFGSDFCKSLYEHSKVAQMCEVMVIKDKYVEELQSPQNKEFVQNFLNGFKGQSVETLASALAENTVHMTINSGEALNAIKNTLTQSSAMGLYTQLSTLENRGALFKVEKDFSANVNAMISKVENYRDKAQENVKARDNEFLKQQTNPDKTKKQVERD